MFGIAEPLPHAQLNRRQFIATVITEYVMIFLALCPFALMVNWIFIPHNVVGGGLTGICSILYYVTRGDFPSLFPATGGAIPIWLSTLVINGILLLLAAILVNWRFCIRTLFGACALAFWYRLIPIRETPLIEDPLLACIVGGALFGVFLGVVMLNNGSSGGTDIVAMIVNHYRDISLGKVMVVCDVLIILSAYFLPIPDNVQLLPDQVSDYRLKRILCGLCMTLCYTASLDWFMQRMNQSVQFFIFSRKSDEIASAISANVNRGITLLDGMGWYSKQPISVVTVLARKHESTLILRIIRQVDSDAFVSYANVSGVFGKGFEVIKAK